MQEGSLSHHLKCKNQNNRFNMTCSQLMHNSKWHVKCMIWHRCVWHVLVELYRWDLGSFYPRRHPWVDLWVFGTCRVLGLRFLDFKLTLRFLDWSCDLFLLYVCLTQFLDTWVDEEKKPEGFFRRLDVWLKAQERQSGVTGSVVKKSLCERVVCWKDGSSWFLVFRDTRGTSFYLTWGFLVEFRFSRFQEILAG